MAKKLVKVSDLPREEWLQYRTIGIGGSDAGAILGMNPWKSAIEVWMEKTGKSKKKNDTEEETESMRLGRDLEDYVARRWEEATGKRVRRNNYMLQHEEYPFMIADLDREVVGENAILECKTASPYSADKWEDGNIPASYTIQCLHYMAVTGADKVYVACLIFGRGIEFRELKRDEQTIKALIHQEKQFWEEYVNCGVMPPPDGSKAADEAIKVIYKESDPDTEAVSLSGDMDRYDEINALISSLKEEKKEMEQVFKTELKEAEIGYCGDRKVTWKTQKGKSKFDGKGFKKDHPELHEAYTNFEEPYRVLRVSKPKKIES